LVGDIAVAAASSRTSSHERVFGSTGQLFLESVLAAQVASAAKELVGDQESRNSADGLDPWAFSYSVQKCRLKFRAKLSPNGEFSEREASHDDGVATANEDPQNHACQPRVRCRCSFADSLARATWSFKDASRQK
jgi:hypothetical protein